jgi:hypothetical protein
MSTGPRGEKQRDFFVGGGPVRAQSQVSRRSNEFRPRQIWVTLQRRWRS